MLAVFHLAGAEDHRRVNGYGASDKLIAQLAVAFAEIMAPRAQLYRSRQDEFWALIDGPIDHARPLLGAATAALRRTGVQANVSAAFGMAFLPAEATEPTEALMIAEPGDRRRPPGARTSQVAAVGAPPTRGSLTTTGGHPRGGGDRHAAANGISRASTRGSRAHRLRRTGGVTGA